MNKKIRTSVAIGVVWLVTAAWIVAMLSSFPGVTQPDTQGQYDLLMQGVYRNWKPALYEFQLAVGEWLWPGQGLGLAYVAQTMAIGIGSALVFTHYAKRHVLYAVGILFLPLFCVSQVVPLTHIINDYMAAGCYMLYIGIILTAVDCRRKGLRNTLMALSLLVLFYGFVLRHNSAFMVIVLAYWGVSKFFPMGRIKKMAVSVGAVALFLLVGTLVNTYLLKCEKSYPLTSPMADDIVNISVLCNQWSPAFIQHYNTKGVEPASISLRAEAGHWNPIINGVYQDPDLEKRADDYRILKEVWKKTVFSHPYEYVATKAFLFHQFLLAARSLSCVGDSLLAQYPHVTIAFYELRRMPSFWLCRQFVALVVIPLMVYGTVILAGMSALRHRFKWPTFVSEVEKDALSIGFAAMMYTASFLLLVLSVSEFRYYAPRLLLCGTAGCLLGVSAILRVRKWIRLRKETQLKQTAESQRT